MSKSEKMLLVVDSEDVEEEVLQKFAPGVQTPLPLHASLMVHGFESLQGLPFGRSTKEQAPLAGSQDGFFWQELGVQTTDVPTHRPLL